MKYEEARDVAQLADLDCAIDEFIAEYRKSRRPPEERQTVILFPGGAGCQLKRSPDKYPSGDITNPSTYDYVWLNCLTFIGAALFLRMERSKDGVYMEADQHIIIASGSVQLFGETPYDDFIDWCRPRGIDLFVYGYDWRRPFEDCARFFVMKFLPHFQKRVIEGCSTNPLAKLSLLGHSLGGMLVNWILRNHHDEIEKIGHWHRAVTVATPFYGYAEQMPRWFAGQWPLNFLGTEEVVRVISSFPAFYTVNFLDMETYDHNKELLEADPSYPLADYPSRDHANPSLRVDPYNPGINEDLVRYPTQKKTGFDMAELGRALKVFQSLAAPIVDASLSTKFFNIRGVLPNPDTHGSTRWGWIDPDFDPDVDDSPIFLHEDVPGDGTQPAWTARLASLPRDNVINAIGDDVEHTFIMNATVVLEKLAGVFDVPKEVREERPKREDRPAIASSAVAMDFIRDLHDHFKDRPLKSLKDADEEVQSYLVSRGRSRYSISSIARRILIDLARPMRN